VTTCPFCGASVTTTDTHSSPYDTSAETVPYIPYTTSVESAATSEKAATPSDAPAPAAPTPQQSLYGPSPFASAATPAATGYGLQATGEAQPTLYASPQQPPNVALQPQPVPTPPTVQRRRGISAGAITLLVILALLVIGGGSGLTYYATVAHPAELDAKATTVVQNLLTAQAQATASVATLTPQQLYTQVIGGRPTINDPLNSPNDSIWIDLGLQTGNCGFAGSAYHAKTVPNSISFCVAPGTNFSNFAFQVQMMIIKGDGGGLIFRTNLSSSGTIVTYFFVIDQYGNYRLDTIQGNGNDKPLQSGTSPTINMGLMQSNLVTVIAHNNKLYLYINKHYITGTTDDSFASGLVGVSAFGERNASEAIFSNAQVWTL